MDMNYTAIILIKQHGDDDWGGLDWWWDIDQESNENPFSLQRGCYYINVNLHESGALHSDENSATVMAYDDLDFTVGDGACVDNVYYFAASEKETEEKVDEEIEEVTQEEVPSLSLVLALISIGLVAVFRRK
jgi:hypothetical protein